MKKRNFKFCLTMIALVLGAFLFSACGKGELFFNQTELIMGVNQEIELKDLVTLKGTSLDKITFESSDSNIVVISPRNTIIAGSQEGSAIITAKGFSGCLEITVQGVASTFATPTNIHYNQESGCIEWDSVYSGSVVANNFKVSIIKNGEPMPEVLVNKNYYKVNDNGSFSVKVACEGRNGVKPSNYSEVYTFTKLSAPFDLQYDLSSGRLTWSANYDAEAFYIKKDGVISPKQTNSYYDLNLEEEKSYTISIISTTSVDQENVFGAESEELVLTRLQKPELEVSQGVLSWTDTQQGVSSYVISVYNNQGLVTSSSIQHNGSNYTYKLAGVQSGTYTIKVVAYGDGEGNNIYGKNNHYLNSAETECGNILKLEKPTLTFNKETKKVAIADYVGGNSYVLNVNCNGSLLEQINISNDGGVVYDFANAGTYTFTAINKASSNSQINSEVSDEIEVLKLPQLEGINQSVDNNGNYVISNLALTNASKFVVEKTYDGTSETLTLNNNNYGVANEIFANDGTYTITITASGNDSVNHYVLNSKTMLSVERLKKATLVDNGSKIVWDSVGLNSGIIYSYEINDDDSLKGSTTNTYYDYNNLPAGLYSMKLYSKSGMQGGTSTLVLDAFDYATINFEITKKIATPNLSVARKNNGYNLNIVPVQNANKYLIKVNQSVFKTVDYNNEEVISVALDDIFASKGNGLNGLIYLIEVSASNLANEHYLTSEIASVNVEKITAPTSFSVSETEVVSTVKNKTYITDFEIFINDEKTNALKSTVDSFDVKIRYLSDVQKYNNTYYVDSDFASFKLSRIPVQIMLNGLVAKWTIAETTQRYTAKLNLSQNGNVVSSTPINSLPQLDLSEINFDTLGLDLVTGFVSSVTCTMSALGNATISGEYVDGKFVSGTLGEVSRYYLSGKSNNITIKYADTALNLSITESAEKINISWTNKDEYSYDVYDGTEIHLGATSLELNSSSFADAKQYLLTITETLSAEQNVYLFHINRLSPITSLTINDDETISVASQTGAERAVITKNNSVIENLSDISTSTEQIKTKYIAKTNINAYTFYLDSKEEVYTFARLDKLNTVTNLNTYNNIVSWTKEEAGSYEYIVKFFDDAETSPYFVTLSAGETNSIDLTKQEYKDILNQFTGKKYIAIQKHIGSYVATSSTNYLSSDYSNSVLLKIIKAPTNVKVEAINLLEQDELKISWTQDETGVEISKYIITITHNGTSSDIETAGIYTIDNTNTLFKDAGVWAVKVKALGSNDSIVSDYSEEITVTRLAESSSLSLGKNGEITWGKVDKVDKYKLIYSYTDDAGQEITSATEVDNNTNISDIFVECLNDTFDGIINLTLYALGDGTSTLSSVKNASFERLKAPELTVKNDRIVIENYLNYVQNTNIYLVAKVDEKVVINSNIEIEKDDANKYVWYLPTEFKYIDESGQTVVVDMSTQKNISFEFVAKNQSKQYLDSNTSICNVTMLSPLTNLRFVRDESGAIHFKANNSNSNATKVKLEIGLLYETLDGDIDIELTEEYLHNFDKNWTINLQAIGELKDSVYYINSKVASISGIKLNAVDLDNISTQNGAVVWQNMENATDYKLCIDETIYKQNYKTQRRETLKDSSFASGEHIITIKALGNITTIELTDNIILDGDYSEAYTVTKLSELSDLAVKNGYFTFTEIIKATEYTIEVFDDLTKTAIAEYPMQRVTDYIAEESYTYYYSSLLLNKLKEIDTLYIKVYNKTTEENYVYSNYAYIEYDGSSEDYIVVQRLENANSSVELYHPTKPDGENLDYLTTIAKWEANSKANNGYVLNIDNELTTLTSNSFMLDEDCYWAAGAHNISYKQLGSSGLTSGRIAYLTAEFSNQTKVIKLAPVQITLGTLATGTKELCMIYNTVAGADRYYSFLEDVFFKEYNNSAENLGILMDELEDGRTYSSFGMRAASTLDIKYLASTISYVTILDEEEGQDPYIRKVQIEKISAPEVPTFNSGAFYWELSDSTWLTMLKAAMNGSDVVVKDPIEITLSSLSTQNLVVQFVSKSSPVTTYSYMDLVANFIYMSDAQKDRLSSLINVFISSASEETKEYVKAQIDNLAFNLKGGFASTRYGFNKFASDLPVGEYDIKVSLVGKNLYKQGSGEDAKITAKFSSSFVSIGTKYVAAAPNITAVATDGIYTLEFNNVNVKESYFTSAPTYSLIGVYYDESLEKYIEQEIATVSASAINNSEKLVFNLTELIENKKLDSKFSQLYVTLKGSNSNVLNGKLSNIIKISVLDVIESKVQHGTIKWHAQQYAGDYRIEYNESGSSDKLYKVFATNEQTEWYEWDSAELTENKLYNVSIQARGFINGRVNNSEIFRMSGKVTSIGNITKLPCISNAVNGVDIVNGLFVWDNVDNATAYDVYYTRTQGENYNIALSTNAYFETLVSDTNIYYYYFMAIGTEEGVLTETSNTYVNSKLSEYNKAQRVKSIETITFNDGIIKFTPSQGYRTNYYKLTFYKIDSNGERGDKLEVFTTDTTYDTNTNASLLSYGKYEVDIQACYKTKAEAVLPADAGAYHIISYANKQDNVASTNYYKFDAVTDVDVTNGRISWTFNNDGQIPASDYAFKLVFTTPTQGEVVKYVASNNSYFEDVVYDDILTSDNITLNVYVCASETARANYVKSIPVQYLNIHQYEQIDESKIEISTTENSQLKVDWTKGVGGISADGFKYEISFTANGKEEKFYTDEPLFITGEGNEVSFDIEGDYTIVIRIRVIPMVDNYISSVWTDNKEVARPKSVSGLSYDANTRTFVWNEYKGTSNTGSYTYKIKDEVTYTNKLGETVTDVYILTASLGDEKFEPFVSGVHKVYVAVMISNSNSDNFISEYATTELVEYNLFGGGNGTKTNPYLIENSNHFNNIQYRMSKDAKNNSYFFGTMVDGSVVLNEEKTILTEKEYFFKQTANITLVKNATVDQTLNIAGLDDFDGVYDGDYYTLALEYTHINETTDFASVSIFNTISKNASVQNLKLAFSITSDEKDNIFWGEGATANINVLCQDNYGSISNILIGVKGQKISIISKDLVVGLSFIANNNYGTISNVQNNYNVEIEDAYNVDQRNIQFASIVIKNEGKVEYVKNNGSIDVTGSNIFVGGIVAYNTKGASITAGANVGNIKVYYKQSATSYVGGLVAKNDNGELSYCYSIGQFSISASSTSKANVGGLIGWSVGDKVSYSYVNVTMTTTITDFNMYQVIGKLESSSNQAKYVYYKQSSTTAGVNGSASSGFKTFTVSPTETGVNLFGDATLFNKSDVDENGNPRLTYEATFENISWK